MIPTDLSALEAFAGYDFPVFATTGTGDRVHEIAQRAERALRWLSDVLGPRRDPVLIISGPDDWPRVAEMPMYGMPQAFRTEEPIVDGRHWKVVVGTEPAAFWDELVGFLDLPHTDPSQIPDLIVIHEFTHVFEGVRNGHELATNDAYAYFPEPWIAEFFANVGLWGYLSDVEPDAMGPLRALSDAALQVPSDRLPIRALPEMFRSFEYENGGVLYCWYQFVLIDVARRFWEAEGASGFRDLYEQVDIGGIVSRVRDVWPD